eukprot:5661244-Prymnesium_polylepis.1
MFGSDGRVLTSVKLLYDKAATKLQNVWRGKAARFKVLYLSAQRLAERGTISGKCLVIGGAATGTHPCITARIRKIRTRVLKAPRWACPRAAINLDLKGKVSDHPCASAQEALTRALAQCQARIH